MKKIYAIAVLILPFIATSCVKIKPMGDLTMISTRNVDTKTEYQLVKNYIGLSKKDKRKSNAKDIEEAVNLSVKSVPGGEFLKNVKLYQVTRTFPYRKIKRSCFIAEGDVWGLPGEISMRGFKVGDKVFWNSVAGQVKGTIVELKDANQAAIQIEGQEKIELVKYEKLTKLNN
jgi:hypothetical protein